MTAPRSRSTAPTRQDDRAQRPQRLPAQRRRVVGAISAAAGVLAVVVVFGLVVFHAWIVQNQSSLDRLDRNIAETSSTNQRLRLEIAELESPERVIAYAESTLGMTAPEPGSVTTLHPISTADLGRDGEPLPEP